MNERYRYTISNEKHGNAVAELFDLCKMLDTNFPEYEDDITVWQVNGNANQEPVAVRNEQGWKFF